MESVKYYEVGKMANGEALFYNPGEGFAVEKDCRDLVELTQEETKQINQRLGKNLVILLQGRR